MSVIREQDFVPKHPEWMTDPEIPHEDKARLAEIAGTEPMSRVECNEIHDDCFRCGEKLTTPYVYWQLAGMAMSLHPHCAAKLALGLAQDARDILSKKREGKVAAADWLVTYAQRWIYGVEDEIS